MAEEWYEKVGRIPRKVMYALTLIILIVPLFVSFALPVHISSETRIMYETIEKLRGTGKRVLFIACTIAAHWGEFYHMYFAIFQHIFLLENVKLIIVPVASPDAPALTWMALDAISNPLNKQYGVDYAVLTFLPDPTAAFASMAENFRATFTADLSGTPIDKLPVMEGVYTLSDFDVIITADVAAAAPQVARIFYPRFPDKTYFGLVLAGAVMMYLPFHGTVFKSALVGPRSAAEYQILYGGPYSGAVRQMDIYSAYHLFILIAIILGNIPFIARKISRRRK